MSLHVRITVLGGPYADDRGVYTGPLSGAPTTALIPEGIVSSRTLGEAANMREAIARALETHEAVEVGSTSWAIRAERVTS